MTNVAARVLPHQWRSGPVVLQAQFPFRYGILFNYLDSTRDIITVPAKIRRQFTLSTFGFFPRGCMCFACKPGTLDWDNA